MRLAVSNLLPPGAAEALYQAVVSFAERSPAVHAKMGAYSYDRVRERFSWPVATEQFLQLFRSVAEGVSR